MIDTRPFPVKRRGTRSHEKEHLFHWTHPSVRELGSIKGDSRLMSCWCPAKVRLQFTRFLEIINVPYCCNDGRGLHGANGWHREQNLSFTASTHDVSDLRIEAFQVFLDQT